KLSVNESFTQRRKNPTLNTVAGLVFCYAFTSHLLDVPGQSCLEDHCQNHPRFTYYLRYASVITGLLTLLSSFIGSYSLRRFGWRFGAIVPPVFFIMFGSCFYLFLSIKDIFPSLPLIFGGLQITLARSIKYAFFDPTKEILYIPL